MQLKASAARHAALHPCPWVTPHQTKEAQKKRLSVRPSSCHVAKEHHESPHDVAAGIQGEAAAGFGSMSALPRAHAWDGQPFCSDTALLACTDACTRDRDSESVHACCRVNVSFLLVPKQWSEDDTVSTYVHKLTT